MKMRENNGERNRKKKKIKVEIIMRGNGEKNMGSVGRKANCGDSEKERR